MLLSSVPVVSGRILPPNMENDRRDFFKAVGAVAAGAMMAAPRSAEAAVTADRYVSAYRQALTIDGAPPEEILSADGGEVRGIVVNEPPVNNQVKKHLSNIAYEDIAIALGASQSTGLYAWIQATLNGSPLPKNGAIISADAQGKPRTQIQFFNGRITEVAFPALDSRSRAAAEMAVRIEPENLKLREPATATARVGGTKQKVWLPSNFRLDIPGLEAACARVTKVDSFSIKQTFSYPAPGREEIVTALPLEVSELVVYCPEAFAEPFRAWARDFIVNGNRTEKTGTLQFLAPDNKKVYFTLFFTGLGIFGCGLEGEDQRASSDRLVKVEMYCETATLTVGAIVST